MDAKSACSSTSALQPGEHCTDRHCAGSLQDLGDAQSLEAVYELEALMLTGQCIDIAARTRQAVSISCSCAMLSGNEKGAANVLRLDSSSSRKLKQAPVGPPQLSAGPSADVMRHFEGAAIYPIPNACAVQMTPRGVQLWLGNEAAPHVRDTLVMSNLGYFQLKAQPGAWNLSLAPGEHVQYSFDWSVTQP